MIVTADLHFGRESDSIMLESEFYPGHRISSKLHDTMKRFMHLVDVAVMSGHALIVAGDIFENPNPKSIACGLFMRALRGAKNRKVDVYLIPGNHDNDSKGSALYAVNEAGLAWVAMDKAEKVTIGTFNCLFIPHGVVPADQDATGCNVVVGHGTMEGGMAAYPVEEELTSPSVFPNKWPSSVKVVLLGHNHGGCAVNVGKLILGVPGSPIMRTFAEVEDEKGYLEVLNGKTVRVIPRQFDDEADRYTHLVVDLREKKWFDEEKARSYTKGKIVKVTVLAKRREDVPEGELRNALREAHVSRFEVKVDRTASVDFEEIVAMTAKAKKDPAAALQEWMKANPPDRGMSSLILDLGKEILGRVV